jgi:putative hydrolase of the HAD superfamily
MYKTFIFDYDDTLAWNMHDYSEPQLEFFRFAIKKLGPRCPDVQTLANLEAETDSAGVKVHGFKLERFPLSFQETYRALCQRAGVEPTPKDLKRAYAIGMKAYDEKRYQKQGLVEGAAETLDFLAGRDGNELILLTKGDERVQQKKIEATGARKWFGDRVHIVPKKDAKVLEDIVGMRNKMLTWHIGNSIRSDVNPAIEARIGMVYVPCETWAYEREHNGLPEYPRLLKVDTIADIVKNYGRLP